MSGEQRGTEHWIYGNGSVILNIPDTRITAPAIEDQADNITETIVNPQQALTGYDPFNERVTAMLWRAQQDRDRELRAIHNWAKLVRRAQRVRRLRRFAGQLMNHVRQWQNLNWKRYDLHSVGTYVTDAVGATEFVATKCSWLARCCRCLDTCNKCIELVQLGIGILKIIFYVAASAAVVEKAIVIYGYLKNEEDLEGRALPGPTVPTRSPGNPPTEL
jgi:hypothetical protein